MTTKRVISASEKMSILNEGMQPGAVITEICRKYSIGSSTYYKWKREGLQGMKEAVAGPNKEVIALKQENARLKKLVADLTIANDVLRDFTEGRRGKNSGGRS